MASGCGKVAFEQNACEKQQKVTGNLPKIVWRCLARQSQNGEANGVRLTVARGTEIDFEREKVDARSLKLTVLRKNTQKIVQFCVQNAQKWRKKRKTAWFFSKKTEKLLKIV